MEIRKMTCPKCGGAVRPDGNLTGGVCPACGMKFGLGAETPLTVPEAAPVTPVPALTPDDYRPGAPAARGRLSMADQKRENARKEEAASRAEAANRAAVEAAQSEKTPGQSSLTAQRLKSAFRAINAKQWMRADATLNDILAVEPDNEEALRGKRLVAAHKTDEPEPAPAPAEPIRPAEQAPAPTPAPVPAPAAVIPVVAPVPAPAPAPAPAEEPAPAPVTPVLVPETETGRRAESEIADTDRRMTARLSDSIDRKRNQKLLNKSNRALAKRKWKKADAYADEILKTDPESAYAYRNKLLAELNLTEERRLAEYAGSLSDHRYFLLALNYSTGALNRRLMNYADASTRSALVIERSQAIREMERFRQAEADTDRRVAEINASLPANFNDEKAEKERNERISKILDRADAFREKKKWAKAEDLYHAALAIDGECADAYLGLLLVSLKLKQEKKLAHCKEPFGTDPNFLLAMHYGSRVMRRRLERYLASAGQTPVSGGAGIVVLPAVDNGAANATGAGLQEMRAEMNHRLDGIEQMLAYGAYGMYDVSRLTPEEISARLRAAEREVYLTRIEAAELAKENALASSERRAELLARLHAKEEEVIRLRAAMRDAEGVVADNEYYISELRDTEAKLEPLFARARKLHKRGKFARADEVYSEILALDPANGDAYLGKLLCDLQLKREKDLKKSRRSFSGDETFFLAVRFSTPDARKRLTKAAEKVDKRLGVVSAKATEKSTRAEKKRIEDRRIARRDTLTQDAERRTKNAVIAGTHAKVKEEDDALAEATRLIKRDKYAKARAILDDLLERSPDLASAYLLRLLCSYSCRKPAELAKVSVPIRDNSDYILAYHFGKGKTRRRLAKYADKADKRAAKAGVKTNSEWAAIENAEVDEKLRDREALYRASGDHAEQRRVKLDVYAVKAAAAAPGRKLGQSKPEHEKTLKRGYKYLKRRKWEQAQACFERVRDDDPADCSVYVGLLLVSLGLREERELAKAKTTFSDNRYYLLALCCADTRTMERLRDYAARADRRFGKKDGPVPVTYTELARQREEVNRRRIDDLERENRDLEAELAKRSEPTRVGAAFAEDDPDYNLHEGGRFAGLKVALFLLGITLAVALVGAAALLVVRYHGSVTEMIDAFKQAFGK